MVNGDSKFHLHKFVIPFQQDLTPWIDVNVFFFISNVFDLID